MVIDPSAPSLVLHQENFFTIFLFSILNVISIDPLRIFDPPRFAPFAIFNMIKPSFVAVESEIEPRVMPDGKTPTTAETGIFSNPEYPVKGISINICSGTTPSLLQGTFCASFPKIIFIADCPGCPSDTLDIVICPYVFIIHHHPSKKRTQFLRSLSFYFTQVEYPLHT